MKEYVKRDMIMGDIVGKYPPAVEVMLGYGLHCVGCHVNAFETLEQGCRGHGMSDEDIEEMLKEINTAIEENHVDSEGKDLVLTKKAVEKVKEFQKNMKKEGHGLRIEIIPGGCSGQSYAMDFDEKSTEEDIVIEQDGVKIFVSKNDMELIRGSTIDFLDTMQGAGFRVDNPNAHNTCGCGESFN